MKKVTPLYKSKFHEIRNDETKQNSDFVISYFAKIKTKEIINGY